MIKLMEKNMIESRKEKGHKRANAYGLTSSPEEAATWLSKIITQSRKPGGHVSRVFLSYWSPNIVKKAAIYARVSTDEQSEKGYSLETQIEACQRFIDQRGLDLAEVYQDDISGAVPIDERPQGRQLQELINRREIGAVVVYQVDRLSRDMLKTLFTVQAWLHAGIEIYFLDRGQVTSEKDIGLVVSAWLGDEERTKIVERTSRGRNAKARNGKAVGSGTAPYGYSYSAGQLTIKESEAEIVRNIFDWYTSGDAAGKKLGYKEIAFRLTRQGVPTPSTSKGWKKKRVRDASIWDQSGVMWILKNETYAGVLRYGKYIGKNGKGGKRPPEDTIAIDVPAIVSRETWAAAQTQRKANRRRGRSPVERVYLLHGLIKCSCGHKMTGTNGYYRCSMRRSREARLEEICQEKGVHGQAIESLVWSYVMGLVTDPGTLEEKLKQAQAEEIRTIEPRKDELDRVEALLIQAEQEADSLAEKIARAKGIVQERLEKRAEGINRRYADLQDRRDHLENSLARRSFTDENITSALDFWKSVRIGLEDPTPEDRRQWLEILRVQVDVKDHKATITCRLPVEPITVELSDRRPGITPTKTDLLKQIHTS
jgi:site-specific DNA recombinase